MLIYRPRPSDARVNTRGVPPAVTVLSKGESLFAVPRPSSFDAHVFRALQASAAGDGLKQSHCPLPMRRHRRAPPTRRPLDEATPLVSPKTSSRPLDKSATSPIPSSASANSTPVRASPSGSSSLTSSILPASGGHALKPIKEAAPPAVRAWTARLPPPQLGWRASGMLAEEQSERGGSGLTGKRKVGALSLIHI